MKLKAKGGMHKMPGGRMMKDSEMPGYGKAKPKANTKKKGK
jgi:hypothetical protein